MYIIVYSAPSSFLELLDALKKFLSTRLRSRTKYYLHNDETAHHRMAMVVPPIL